ncbi:helix-turn-helix domain-containing protein [Spirosoma koreense]
MPSTQTIAFLRDASQTPVVRNYYENWSIRSFCLDLSSASNYLSPNRRDFYKVLMLTKANGLYTVGTNTYAIQEPTILFIPPSEIISWQSRSNQFLSYYCLFRKSFVDEYPNLRTTLDRYRLFADPAKHVIRISTNDTPVLIRLFEQMHEAEQAGGPLMTDAMQAYLQLILIESIRVGNFPTPDAVTDDYKRIHQFFDLLEKETANLHYAHPVRIRTAREFADDLGVSPNHLNALLKKHTGQPVSAHIKNRLLDESKALLLQTDWTLQDIGYTIGFADQPNFSAFFKRATGLTPASFRKQHHR